MTNAPENHADLPKPESGKRYMALDSIRGLAGLSVVSSHIFEMKPLHSLLTPPLLMFLPGRASVLLFYVLSGFVLASQLNSKKHTLISFYVRRFFRIYPPYLVSLLVVVLCIVISKAVNNQSEYVHFMFWDTPITPQDIWGHLLLIVIPFTTGKFNGVIWSLVYEMRMSVVFPLVMVVFRMLGVPITVVGAFVFAVLGCVLAEKGISNEGNHAVWLPTLRYLFMAICGASLSICRERVMTFINSPARAYLLTAVGISAISLSTFIGRHLSHSDYRQELISDCVVTVAVLALMAATFTENRVRSMLEHPWLATMGKISYSVYLFHLVMLFLLVNLLSGKIPDLAIILIEVALLVPVSFLSYRFIEVPSMWVGVQVVNWINARVAASKVRPAR